MPRYYQASTPDRSGEMWAQAIGNAFQSYQQAKRQKKDDALADEDRSRQQETQDLQLALQGLHRGSAPQEAATPVGGGFARTTPTQDVTQPAGGAFDLSKIAPVTRAPSQYTQLTPGFYRDERQVAQESERASKVQFQQAMGQALAKAQAERLAAQQAPRVAGTLTVQGPDGKPVVANRYDNGDITPTGYTPYEKPQPTADERVSLEARMAEARARATAKYREPPRRLGAPTSKGATFEANWKGRRFQQLVQDQRDALTGFVTKGLSPAEAQARIANEWKALSSTIPADYLKAAEQDPEYAAYLRSQIGGSPEDEQ